MRACGDGYVNAAGGEQCDDGLVDSATCDYASGGANACTPARCGDGYMNAAAGETCETTVDSVTCEFAGGALFVGGVRTEACTAPLCGDGYANPTRRHWRRTAREHGSRPGSTSWPAAAT